MASGFTNVAGTSGFVVRRRRSELPQAIQGMLVAAPLSVCLWLAIGVAVSYL